MKTATVSKTFEFSAAHILPNHPGKCKNLHGHNYKVEVKLTGPLNEETGMVIDFGDLKETVNHYIDQMDHSFISADLCKEDEGLFKYLVDMKSKVFILMGYAQSTAENLANYLAIHILEDIADNFAPHTFLELEVIVWETSNSYATCHTHNWFGEDDDN